MKLKTILICITILLFCSQNSNGQSKVSFNNEDNGPIINKNIYGHFAEHLGRCIYGGIYVGENSSIPNTDGVRNDIIDALKALRIPNLRWPGGCFADIYHWKDGIGPKNLRNPIENTSWGGREDNSFGTHEFLDLCEMIGAEPYLAVNMNTGSVQEAVEWEQYVNNANGSSSLTDLRAKNGRDKPWNVKFWGIGNESWDCGGHMTADYYANLYKRYATAMTSYGNTEKLYRIAVGPGSTDYNWTETVMKNVPARRIEGLSIHHYSVIDWSKKGSSYEFTEEQYFKTMNRALLMDEFITKNSEIMDKYDPDKRVALVVDEWGGWYDTETGGTALYQQNTMRDAMISGVTLNIFNNHADRVRMANLAQTVNVLQAVILTEGEKMLLTPTYHVMKMYNVHQDAQLLPISFESPSYELNNETLPALSVSASKDKNGKVHVSLVNIDSKNGHSVEFSLNNLGIKALTGTILSSEKLQDHNTFDNPNKVQPKDFKEFKVKNGTLSMVVPTFSVVVLEGK